MTQPTADPAGTAAAAAPIGSIFTPAPPAAAAPPPPAPPAVPLPPPAAAPPPPAPGPPASYKEQAYLVMGRHHGIQGRLDVLERRLGELLAGHAALISHISANPAPASAAPGATSFWGGVLDQHQLIHGLLKAAEAEVSSLLAAHGGVIGALESFL